MERGNKPQIVSEIEKLVDDHFEGRQYFMCTYGSYATNQNNVRSDLDVFFATPQIAPGDLERLSSIVRDFHYRSALTIDQEVPFSNKLLSTYEDVEAAIDLKGLAREGNIYKVPPIVKSSEFLSSIEVKYRLLFNALTSPHYFSGNDFSKYAYFLNRAKFTLYQLIHDIMSVRQGVRSEINDMLEAMLQGNNGEEGEDYLGYKRNPATIIHLTETITEVRQRLQSIVAE